MATETADFLFFLDENRGRAGDDHAEKQRLLRIGHLYVDLKIADLQHITLAQTRRLHRLLVDVRPGDRALIRDQIPRGIALDDRMLQRHRRILRAQFLIRPAPDAKDVALNLRQSEIAAGGALDEEGHGRRPFRAQRAEGRGQRTEPVPSPRRSLIAVGRGLG